MKALSISCKFKQNWFLWILFCLIPLTSFSQQNFTKEIAIQSDNDAYLFINQDQYYTNGIQFFYRSLYKPHFTKKDQAKQIREISIGHKLYNAYNGYSEYAYIDRPFTAYIYINGKNTWFYKNESVLSAAAELGAYGKMAFGEQLQEGFHNLLGFYEINGWQYQLKSHVTFDLRARYSLLLWRNAKKNIDLQGGAQAALGLNQPYLSIAPMLRVGKINRLSESSFHRSRLKGQGRVPTERYFYYVPNLFYRFYDASIQGGMLLQNKGPVTFGIKPIVFSQRIGFSYASGRFSIDAHLVFNTKAVKSSATAHQYGSLSLAYAL